MDIPYPPLKRLWVHRSLKTINQPRHRLVEYELHVAGYGDARRDLNLPVEHPQHASEFRILDDLEGTMAARAPHRKQEAQPRGRVRRAAGESRDGLSLGRWLRVAGVDVTFEVAGRILVVGTVHMFGRVANR